MIKNHKPDKKRKKLKVCSNFICIKSSAWNEDDPAFEHEEHCNSCENRSCDYCGYLSIDGNSCELGE